MSALIDLNGENEMKKTTGTYFLELKLKKMPSFHCAMVVLFRHRHSGVDVVNIRIYFVQTFMAYFRTAENITLPTRNTIN